MQVKCTSCGAFQNISKNQGCDYCGNLIELESGKSNYEKTANSEIGNLIIIAETAVEAENWDEALQFFNQVLVKDISNPDVWLGKGIAMVYLSKIGDLKIKEAIAYWKNAIKYASNQEAMSRRVAREIDEAVNKFYPVLENHFSKFQHLDNSYVDLVEKFVILETAQDYAVQLSPNDVKYSITGYNLCKRVIELPKAFASIDEWSGTIGEVAGAISKDYLLQKKSEEKKRQAQELNEQVKKASELVYPLQNKYIRNIRRIDPSNSLLQIQKENEKEVIEKLEKSGTTVFISGVIGFIILGLFAVKILEFGFIGTMIFSIVGFFVGIYAHDKIITR